MDEWLANLWNKNKFIFFLLLPILLLLVFKDLIIEILIGSARKMGQEALKTDSQLKADQQKAQDAADAAKAQADAIKAAVSNVKVDEDWNKK